VNLPQLPVDKANHYLVGSLIATLACLAARQSGMSPQAWAFGACVAAGAMKECSDWIINRRARALGAQPTHGVEFGDFLATTSGSLPVIAGSWVT
jgi:hypothetical protein